MFKEFKEFISFIGLIIGALDSWGLSIVIGKASIKYGMFIQNVVNLLIIAFSVFMIVKAVNKVRRIKPEEKEEEVVEAPSKEEALLAEIRDLLKAKN